jgi:hypothetical protein
MTELAISLTHKATRKESMIQKPEAIKEVNAVLAKWASPLLNSFAFTRLSNITFLGILSPRYSFLPGFPFKALEATSSFDGSRADHSIGVALLLSQICRTFRLSETAQKYGLAWALLHDIATWPLAHTGEPAFSSITKIDSHTLRELIIRGSSDLPEYLTVRHQLDKMKIDVEKLLLLYAKESNQLDRGLSALWKIVNSPLTPDTLEGMQRSGRVYHVQVPDLAQITESFVSDLFSDPIIEREKSKAVLQFWRAKSRIYENYINSKRAIRFESEWALRIEDCFSRIGLVESLLLPENCILASVMANVTDRSKYREKRYKAPLAYFVAGPHSRKKILARDYKLDDLSGVLGKRRKVSS